MTTLRLLAAAALLLAAAGPSPAVSGPLARHRCEVLSRLTRIHERGPQDSSRDRFIVLSLPGRPQSYVQCIFHPFDRRMLCEASSGAYGERTKDEQADISVAAIEALGFVQKSAAENFQREVEPGAPPDLGRVVDLMLAALAQGYGAQATAQIEIKAPKAKGFDGRCNPVAALP